MKMSRTDVGRWAMTLVAIVAFAWAAGWWRTRGHIARVLPSQTLPALSGQPVTFDSLRGKPTLVAFWAPWCDVCKAESQNLSWVRKIAGQKANVVSVAAAFSDVEEVRQYVQGRGVDYPVLLGDDNTVRDFHVSGFPTVYFLDETGKVKRSTFGYTSTVGLLVRLFI